MRVTTVLLGLFLTLVATVVAAQMMKSGEPFEPLVPCALGILGIGLFGFGLLFPVSLLQPEQCEMVDHNDSEEGAEVDGD